MGPRENLALGHEAVGVVYEDVFERILALTSGIGVDTAVEALDANSTFQNCVRVTKAGARSPTSATMAKESLRTCPVWSGGRASFERLPHDQLHHNSGLP